MNETALKSGSCLKNGEYSIIRVLGQGGFGITYEAEQVSLGRKVAVKEFFMKEYCERDGGTSHVTMGTSGSKELVSKFKDKFIREARMIAALDHEHIVKIYDVFEENGTAYYVMEYLGGGSLDRNIKDKGAMSENEAFGFIRQIASALGYLHSQNILHFDVKPSNVLLGKNGSAKLIDFGISKHYDEAGQQTSSTPVGISKGYAPLEQYQQGSDIKSFTPATDIYSLGATLYALLSGSNPPEASVVNEEGIPVINGVSPVVMRVIEKAMQPRRKDRPQSVREFLGLLNSKSKDDEKTSFPSLKTDKKKVGEHQQKSKVSKEQKRFPKWVIGVIAGVVIAVLWPKNDKPDGGDNPLADSTTAELFEIETEQSVNDFIKPPKSEQAQTQAISSSSYATTGTNNGYEWVDLGLSVKWATMNVGATSPEDDGDYFAWGETSPKSDYEWSNLKYCTGGEWGGSKYSKYVTDSEYGPVDNKTRLELSDDAARANWGGSWRMPTNAEFKGLKDKCTWTWTTMNGKNGYKVVSTVNGNSIFLPAAGRRFDTSLDRVGSWGFYWSSSLYVRQLFCAHAFYFNSGKPITDYCDRRVGHSVRPVCP